MTKLEPGIYEIPEGYTIARVPGERTVEIRAFHDRRVSDKDRRCKNCIFYADGQAMKNQWYKSKVCTKRPKAIPGLFYATVPYGGKDCPMFVNDK